MLVSPFTPLFFLDPKVDGIECPYIQTFASTDNILIELIMSGANDGDDKWNFKLMDITRGIEYNLNCREWYINDNDYLNFCVLSGLNDGKYTVILRNPSYEIHSTPFCVTSDESILQETSLIQYSMKNNRQRKDALFFIENMHYFFEFRVPGGFKDNGWSFGVDSEQFTTEIADPVQLYGRERTIKKLTMGTSEGCPIWFGDLLNRLLCCTYIYIDGVRYARADSSVPEITNTQDGVNSFIFSQSVQQVINDDFMDKHADIYHIGGGVYDPNLNRRFTNKQMLILRSLADGDLRDIVSDNSIISRKHRNIN